MTEFRRVVMKRVLSRNDGGVWGADPVGDNGTIVLRSTDIAVDGSWTISSPAVRQLSSGEAVAARLIAGDLVVVKSSGSAAHLGKTALVTSAVAAMAPCFANFVQRLRVNADEVDARFAWYFLNSRLAAEQLEQLGTTTTGLRNISRDTLGSLIFPFARLAEQRAIADYLDVETARIDALIASKRRMRGLLLERWQLVMQHAVAGRLDGDDAARRHTSVPWLTDVPSNWREAHLKLVATLGTGHTPSRSHPEWWADLTIPWITTGEVVEMRSDDVEYVVETREKISELGMANSSATLHPAGTVVLCRTASAGYSAIMGADMATSQDFATWTCGPLLRPRFLLLCLRAMRQDLLGRLRWDPLTRRSTCLTSRASRFRSLLWMSRTGLSKRRIHSISPCGPESPALTPSLRCSPSGVRL